MKTSGVVYVAVFDDLADWEMGYLLVELRTGRFTGTRFDVRTVAQSLDPITTMGGVRVVPDLALSSLEASQGDLLVLPGGGLWDKGQGAQWAAKAQDFLDAGKPVAAICGATAGLARSGMLDTRLHTSSMAQYLDMQEGYHGQACYRDVRAISDHGLITAGPQSPVQFATETLRVMGLASDKVLEAYEAVFCAGDTSAYATLMQPSR